MMMLPPPRITMMARIRNFLAGFRDRWRAGAEWRALNRMADYWRRQKAVLPLAKAMAELHWRGLIEEFRDYASDRYLKSFDRCPTVGEPTISIKAAWLEEVLKPIAPYYPLKEIRMMRDLIRDMPPNEVFHADVYRIWSEAINRSAANVLRGATLTPQERRVLLRRDK